MKAIKWLDEHFEETLLVICLVLISVVCLIQVIIRNIPFISSLRGYYMTNTVPYTCPLTLYGNSKFKGALVMDEPLTVEEYNTLTAAYEIDRAAALAE